MEALGEEEEEEEEEKGECVDCEFGIKQVVCFAHLPDSHR